MKSKYVSLTLLAVSFSQTGCIVGIATGNGLLVQTGILTSAGVLIAADPDDEISTSQKILAALFVSGIALDNDNPGRSDALNWIPVDSRNASKLSTTLDALETYNQELAQIMDANAQIENSLRPIAEGARSKEAFTELANTVGLGSADELMRVLSGEHLSRDDQRRFADRFSLSPETARIFLKLRFGINSLP